MKTFISDLHLVINKKHGNPNLLNIYFKNGNAYVSDGHILIRQPLSYSDIEGKEALENVAISGEKFKAIRKMKHVTATKAGFYCVSKDGESVLYEYEKDFKMPDFESVIPKPDKEHSLCALGIDLEKLNKLRLAMIKNEKGVKMTFTGENKPILINPLEEDFKDELGVIMPLYLPK